MRHVVLAVVTLAAVLLLTLGTAGTAPVAGVVLGLCALAFGAVAPVGSGVGDEPRPLGR